MIEKVSDIKNTFFSGPRNLVVYYRDVTDMQGATSELVKIISDNFKKSALYYRGPQRVKTGTKYVIFLDSEPFVELYEPVDIKDKAFLLREVNDNDPRFDELHKAMS